MPISVPKWLSDVAIVGLIFSVGVYATQIKTSLDNINDIEKKLVAIETAIEIHHGMNWPVKVKNATLMKVEDLEEKIGGVSLEFKESISTMGNDFDSTVQSIDDLQKRIIAVDMWTRQGDDLIRKSRLEQFRALTVYTTAKSDNPSEVYVNKQHKRGDNFKKGDSIILINPLPPGRQVEVTVKDFLDDPASPNVLVQLNEELLDDLNLSTQGGQYELFIQSKPEALRWKSLDELYRELKSK